LRSDIFDALCQKAPVVQVAMTVVLYWLDAGIHPLGGTQMSALDSGRTRNPAGSSLCENSKSFAEHTPNVIYLAQGYDRHGGSRTLKTRQFIHERPIDH
jgi:hypothetical protein